MGVETKIQWTHHTFNPWRGCTKVSPGCKNCYAERQSARNPAVLGEWGPQGTRVLASLNKQHEPLQWSDLLARDYQTKELVFCASLADVFEDWSGQMTDSKKRPLWVSRSGVATEDCTYSGEPFTLDHARKRLWNLINCTPNLVWQLLTKRPENIARMMPWGKWSNVWLGVSVEDQEYTWRLDALAEAREHIECPVGFISAEPLLGPLSLWDQLPGVEWVIVGGESGSQARTLYTSWVRSLIAQCQHAQTPIFVKQMGREAVDDGVSSRMRLRLVNDPGHGGDERDWPKDLRVRQFPEFN